MKASGGLAALLAQTVVAGDVNACCGVLRRIFSETLQEDLRVTAAASNAGRNARRRSYTSARTSSSGDRGTSPAASTLASYAPPSSLSSSSALNTPSGHNDVVNFARYAQHQRAQAHSFANATAQAALRTSFAPPGGVQFGAAAAVGTRGHPTDVVGSPSHASSSSFGAPTDTPLAQRVWKLAKSSLAADSALVKASSLHVLCHTAQRTGYWEEALHFCEYLPQSPAPLFLSSLLRPGNVNPILQYCTARGWALDVTNAIRVLAEEHGSWLAALVVAQDAERRLPCGEVYSLGVLVPYLAASGAATQARQLFESGLAHGALMDPVLVQQLVMQTATLRQWETCLHMLQCLYRTHETAQLLPADADFFGRLMEVSPGWVTSLQLLHMARASDVKPNERTVAILLTQCDQAGAWREAAAVYDMAVKEDFIDSLAVGSTYHTLVRSFSAIQQWQKALEALSWMSKADDASLTAGMTELVTLCEQSGQWEAALSIGATLMESGVHLLSPQTSMALLFVCAKGAQWEFATRLFNAQLNDVRVDPHPLSLCSVMQACVAAGQWEAALRVYDVAKSSQPRTVVPPIAHRIAVKACMSAGKWNLVIAVLDAMQQDGLPLDNHSQRLGLWAAAIQGQWELSLAFLQAIPRRSRTLRDRIVVRDVTRAVSPAVDAIALRFLQSR
ncbi:hypothetical protein CUR178_03198 [Leishmania enriettii]|uniref:Uncharacterized protein n=1 Tax=Leishmania enriettii TaxID=5663 RepID=A0A836HAS2_LEIEN|nr:hypothetical protein CUR178_03198 [Leishmania enriettii]